MIDSKDRYHEVFTTLLRPFRDALARSALIVKATTTRS
jgi:hypothetical protein